MNSAAASRRKDVVSMIYTHYPQPAVSKLNSETKRVVEDYATQHQINRLRAFQEELQRSRSQTFSQEEPDVFDPRFFNDEVLAPPRTAKALSSTSERLQAHDFVGHFQQMFEDASRNLIRILTCGSFDSASLAADLVASSPLPPPPTSLKHRDSVWGAGWTPRVEKRCSSRRDLYPADTRATVRVTARRVSDFALPQVSLAAWEVQSCSPKGLLKRRCSAAAGVRTTVIDTRNVADAPPQKQNPLAKKVSVFELG